MNTIPPESAGINIKYFLTELCQIAGISTTDNDIFSQSVGESILKDYKDSKRDSIAYQEIKAHFLEKNCRNEDYPTQPSQSNRCNTTAPSAEHGQSSGEIGMESAPNETEAEEMPVLAPMWTPNNDVSVSDTPQIDSPPHSSFTSSISGSSDNAILTAAIASENCEGDSDGNATRAPAASQGKIELHGVLHKTKGNFRCNCNEKFRTYAQLNLHIRKNNEDWRFKCDSCHKTFFINYDLKRHQKSKRCRHNKESSTSDSSSESNETGVGTYSMQMMQCLDGSIDCRINSKSGSFIISSK